MKSNLIFFVTISLLLLSCNKKLLVPLSKGSLEQKFNKKYNNDVIFFIYPDTSLNVVASENCVIKTVQKIEDDYYIIAAGKYEISYAMLSESYTKEGEKIKRGERIGKLKGNLHADTVNFNHSYLMVTIKDNQGHYIENYNVFK